MRQLTFRGFVTQYVQSLSLTGTLSLSKLFEEMTTQNARLKAPLFAYAVESGKLHTLLNVCRENQAVFAEYTALYEMLNKNEHAKWSSDDLPPEYQKVWNSFCSVKRQGERDDRVKQLMADKITAIQQEKGLSTYRMCKDLQLNNANVNAWLKNRDPKKIGLDTARAVLRYAERYTPALA